MTTAQDQQSRAEFEAFWRKEMNVQAMDLARTNYPMTPPEKQQYLCHETNRAWITWQAARALPAPENVREGEPYDNPAFEDLARTMGVWGTAQAALCAQFFIAGRGALPASMKPVAEIFAGDLFRVSQGPDAEPVTGDHDLYTAAQVLVMGRVPPGWQAVPVEPDAGMEYEGVRGWNNPELFDVSTASHGFARAVACFKAMLAAAPRPPAAPAPTWYFRREDFDRTLHARAPDGRQYNVDERKDPEAVRLIGAMATDLMNSARIK